MRNAVFFWIVSLLMVSGCVGGSGVWYKPGHNQADFDLDHRECQIIGQEIGRQATITGEKTDLDVFATTYTNCLFSRGWTQTPPGEVKAASEKTILAAFEGNRLQVFGETIFLPDGFRLVSNQVGGFEDVWLQALVLEGSNSVVLNIVVQQTGSRRFDPIDYPVNEPFFVFDRGTEALDGKTPLFWAVFSGQFQETWLAGVGAFLLVDKDKRINLVFTTEIPLQSHSPPAGLKLTKSQKEAVVAFSDEWLAYIRHFQQPPD